MAPTRRAKAVKRYSNVSEASPGVVKNKQGKRKFSDQIGPPWSEKELERFYDAYRKYGQNWKKVAAVVRNRNAEMVESLYNISRAYLSLPEGYSTVVGFKAMMKDHYNANAMDDSESEQESNDVVRYSRKPQKRKPGKDSVSKDMFHSHLVASADGCLSYLKRRRLDGNQPRAVGKRTPRFPVQYSSKKDDGESYASPFRKGRKEADNDYDVAEVAALLTEASHRGGSPQLSQTPYVRSSVQSSQRTPPLLRKSRRDASLEEDWLEGSVGSRGAETGDYTRDSSFLMDMEGVGTVEINRKGKKDKAKDIRNHQFDDGGEACSGTEEGLNVSTKGKLDIEASNAKGDRFSSQVRRKDKLYCGDDSELDALQTLADLSLMMPASTMESGPSMQLKDEKTTSEMEEKSNIPKSTSTSQFRSKNKLPGGKLGEPIADSQTEGTNAKKSKLARDVTTVDINVVSESEQPHSTSKSLRRKRKPSRLKMSNAEENIDPTVNEPSNSEAICQEENKPVVKGKRTGQISTPSKEWKSVRPADGSLNSDFGQPVSNLMTSTAENLTANQVHSRSKQRSRRKRYIPRSAVPKSSENILKTQLLHKEFNSVQDRVLYLKEKMSCCLSSHLVRRWCTFEWFYSAIDYPWFVKREFEEYLNHVGLGHVPRLTRVEWGVIRSCLGRPRRLSEHFLREERDKLKQYRESVRGHYAELRSGVKEGLPTDLARPLSVGQRVIALHPKTREIHDGSVLTVDHDKCRVQFDCPEIGVEFVMDVDCMPSNPLDNMPEALKRQNVTFDKFPLTLPHLNGNLNFERPVMEVSSGHVEKEPSPMNTSLQHGKGDTDHIISQPRETSVEISGSHTAGTQPGVVAHNQAREVDIRALSDLNRALDKKKALLMELSKINNILENQNSGECSLKDCDKKHYATVLVQLNEASGQVSSALLGLRQRNTYPVNTLPPPLKHPTNFTVFSSLPTSFDISISQESGSSVAEIVEVSRLKAHTLVNAAVQAMSSRKEGEEAYVRVRRALDSIDIQNWTSDSKSAVTRIHEPVNGTLGLHNQSSEPNLTSDSSGPKLHTQTDKTESRMLSEVITACVMAVHMIQTCTERQYPPAVVAQVLDYAVTCFHPRCPQNVGMYREIQMCMGRIKTQILALVPT
ncbi:protein ALWAYS EARLY 2 isoform X2 [Argentina anserina]|uniref:protein ALWAYS EARLY 2 isoform X2 n=1 Tax=Argentina anserina TaxID=57926 RepID=UPI0021764B14|nr:protein ALWAYS EARLY 2 isoform X2 [Potentilla anserina]